MRNKILIRCGLASLLVGGVAGGMFAAGCGSSSNGGNNNNNGNDSGGTDSGQPGDDGGPTTTDDGGPGNHPDSGPNGADGGDGAAPPVDGKLILVHGSANAGALRFCLGSVHGTGAGQSTTILPSPPQPNTAQGVLPGTGGSAGDLGDFHAVNLAIYAINASALTNVIPTDAGAELNCLQLIGPNANAGLGLVEGTNYWNLGTLPSGTLAFNTSTLVVVTGCAPGNNTNAVDECPASADGGAYNAASGNLGLWVSKLDTTTPIDGGGIGTQFAHASYPFATFSTLVGGAITIAGVYQTTLNTPDGGTVDAGPTSDAAVNDAATEAGDGATADATVAEAGPPPAPVSVTTPFPIVKGITYGQLAPTPLQVAPPLTLDTMSGVAFTALNDAGSPTPLSVPIPFPSIQALSEPTLVDAGEFKNGTGYVFVLVGDPRLPSYIAADGGPSATAQAGATFNLYSVHILGFPSNPPF